MRTSVKDQSFLSKEGNIDFLLSQHFVDFAPPAHGFVTMFSVDGNGRATIHHRDPNVVVHSSRKILAKLLAHGRVTGGDSLDYYIITKCKFGNCNIANDTMVTTAPVVSADDTALVEDSGNLFVVSGTNFTVESVTQLEGNAWATTFMAVMDVNEGYGSSYRNYTEMGLYSENDILFARKTYPSFIKTADRKLVVFWTIVF